MADETLEIKAGKHTFQIYDGCRIAAHEKAGGFEPETRKYIVELFEKYIKNDDKAAFMDVGAYTGIYSLLALMHNVEAFCFEPNPDNFERLADNIELNEYLEIIPETNYDMFRGALAEKERDCFLYFSETPLTSGGNIIKENKNKIEITVRTLDNIIFNEIEDFDFEKVVIKIDVEGAEPLVIRGAEDFIQKFQPIIIAECLDKNALKLVQEELDKIWEYKIQKVLDKRNYVFTAADA